MDNILTKMKGKYMYYKPDMVSFYREKHTKIKKALGILGKRKSYYNSRYKHKLISRKARRHIKNRRVK